MCIRDSDNDDFCLFFQLKQHFDFAVRLKTGQDPGGVMIVKKFSTKFQIKLAAKLFNPFFNPLGLQRQIFFVVKTEPVHVCFPL